VNYVDGFLGTTFFNRLFIISSLLAFSGALAYLILDRAYPEPQQALAVAQQRFQPEVTALENNTQAPATASSSGAVRRPDKVFSLTDFVMQAGGKLLAWRPGEQHSVLVLSLPWERVSFLFDRLARYRALELKGLNLKGEGERVIATLTLGLSDGAM